MESVDGWTPLHMAAHLGDMVLCRDLVGSGMGVDDQDLDGASALLVALEWGRADCARLLFKAGADLSVTGSHGRSFAHFAVISKDFECIAAAMEFGFAMEHWTRVDHFNMTAFDCAKRMGVLKAVLSAREAAELSFGMRGFSRSAGGVIKSP